MSSVASNEATEVTAEEFRENQQKNFHKHCSLCAKNLHQRLMLATQEVMKEGTLVPHVSIPIRALQGASPHMQNTIETIAKVDPNNPKKHLLAQVEYEQIMQDLQRMLGDWKIQDDKVMGQITITSHFQPEVAPYTGDVAVKNWEAALRDTAKDLQRAILQKLEEQIERPCDAGMGNPREQVIELDCKKLVHLEILESNESSIPTSAAEDLYGELEKILGEVKWEMTRMDEIERAETDETHPFAKDFNIIKENTDTIFADGLYRIQLVADE